MPKNASKPRLVEKTIKEALANLDWPQLEAHLNQVGIDEDTYSILLGHIRRTNSFILPYPNPKRQKTRELFFERLGDHIHKSLGTAVSRLTAETAELNKIEQGYRSILAFLDQCEISKLAPDVRIAAYLSRAAGQYD